MDGFPQGNVQIDIAGAHPKSRRYFRDIAWMRPILTGQTHGDAVRVERHPIIGQYGSDFL